MRVKKREVLKFIILDIISPLTVFIIGGFLLMNIIYSQAINPLYNRVIDNDRPATIEFLKKIRSLPVFKDELMAYQSTYGSVIADEVFKEERSRKAMIGKLESLLEKNPKSPDVLYELYELNKTEGNIGLAKQYLERAKEIDPSISN
jgi:hypothetical protein